MQGRSAPPNQVIIIVVGVVVVVIIIIIIIIIITVSCSKGIRSWLRATRSYMKLHF